MRTVFRIKYTHTHLFMFYGDIHSIIFIPYKLCIILKPTQSQKKPYIYL